MGCSGNCCEMDCKDGCCGGRGRCENCCWEMGCCWKPVCNEVPPKSGRACEGMYEDDARCAKTMAAAGSYGMGTNSSCSVKRTKGAAACFFLPPLFLLCIEIQ